MIFFGTVYIIDQIDLCYDILGEKEAFMESFTSSILLHWLDGSIVRSYQGRSLPACGGGIRLLEPSEGTLSSEFLYLGGPEEVRQALALCQAPNEPVLIVSSAGPSVPGTRELSPEITLVETDLSLAALYNRLHTCSLQFTTWQARMQEVVYTNSGIQELLQRAAELLPATLLLLNPGYRYMAAVYNEQVPDHVADEVRDSGYLSFDTIQSTRHQTPIRGGKGQGFVEFVAAQSRNYVMIRDITYQGQLAARLMSIQTRDQPDPYHSDLAEIITRYISQFLFSSQSIEYNSNAAFGCLVADLIEFRLTEPEELEQRLKQVHLAVRKYYHVMVISFDSGPDIQNIPWNYIISLLERILPFSNITTYRGEILILVRKTHRGIHPHFDQTALEQLLERYDGRAAIGNFSEFLTSLPSVYYQTRSALRLGLALDPDKRIYFYEDYSMYQIVEMAAQMLRQEMGSRNIVHLCHPSLISLVMDDKRTGGNLTDILYEYLCNERNAALAAKRLYIHRNTMLYKIRKIEDIIGQSLDEPSLRERLLFSYRVLEYMRRYCKEDILLLKRNYPEEK